MKEDDEDDEEGDEDDKMEEEHRSKRWVAGWGGVGWGDGEVEEESTRSSKWGEGEKEEDGLHRTRWTSCALVPLVDCRSVLHSSFSCGTDIVPRRCPSTTKFLSTCGVGVTCR
jgi:hypothetical protein